MEKFFIMVLPKDRYPVVIRYLATLVVVGLAYLLCLSLATEVMRNPLMPFFPAIVIAALVFDRGSGFLATIASAILATVFVPFGAIHAVGLSSLLTTMIFVVIGFFIASVIESLRTAVQKLARAQEQKSLLLEELAHRNKNDLNMVASLLALQARSQPDPVVRVALDAAISRIQVLAKAQDRLNGASDGGTVEIATYLEALCTDLGNLLRDVRPIAIRVQADRIELTSSQAASIGLIVNELVTNALKYAFPRDQGGMVDVIVRREGNKVTIVVLDDGVGCSSATMDGLGSRLVRMMARQFDGTMERRSADPGCRVVVEVDIAHA